MSVSFAKLGKFYFIILSNRFAISCSFFFWHPYDMNVGLLEIVPRYFFILFSSCSDWWFVFLGFVVVVVVVFKRGREGEREGDKHQCVVASPTPPTGNLA